MNIYVVCIEHIKFKYEIKYIYWSYKTVQFKSCTNDKDNFSTFGLKSEKKSSCNRKVYNSYNLNSVFANIPIMLVSNYSSIQTFRSIFLKEC